MWRTIFLFVWLAVLLITFGCSTTGAGVPGPKLFRSAKQTAAEEEARRLAEYNTGIAKGRTFEKSGKWEDARQAYQPLIQRFPEYPEAYHRLGVVADYQRRHREAEKLYLEALKRDAGNAEILNNLGYCYLLQGDLAKAESQLRKATEAAPLSGRAWNNLGIVYGHQRRYEDALEAFRQAGSDADAYYNLAFVFVSQGDDDAARASLRRALVHDPSHELARRVSQVFERRETLDEEAWAMADFPPSGDANWVPYLEGNEQAGPETVRQVGFLDTNLARDGGAANPPATRNAGAATRTLQKRARTEMHDRMLNPGD